MDLLGAVVLGGVLGMGLALRWAGVRFQRRVERAVRVEQRNVYRPGPVGEIVYVPNEGEVYVSDGVLWIDCPSAREAVALSRRLQEGAAGDNGAS